MFEPTLSAIKIMVGDMLRQPDKDAERDAITITYSLSLKNMD